jgi:hypothetical protein
MNEAQSQSRSSVVVAPVVVAIAWRCRFAMRQRGGALHRELLLDPHRDVERLPEAAR